MIFISGYTASGKSTIINLLQKNGYLVKDISDQTEFRNFNNADISNLGVEVSPDVLSLHNDFVADFIKEFREGNYKDVVISGFRDIKNISLIRRLIYLNQEYGAVCRNYELVYVKTDPIISLKRYLKRESDTKQQFEQAILQDEAEGVKSIINNATIVLDNNSDNIEATLNILLRQLEEIRK